MEILEEKTSGAMTQNGKTPVDLNNPSYYINRELSNVEFNRRVLNEATNLDHPLLERVKFLAIFGSNMDEFFMVRVSGLKQQVMLGIAESKADGLTPREQLVAINRFVGELFEQASNHWENHLKPELKDQGIIILNYSDLGKRPQSKLRTYFDNEIFPVLTPLAFDPGHPFPHISNLSLNLAVALHDPKTDESHFARVKVPPSLPRLIPLKPLDPDELLPPTTQKFVWIEEVIAANLDRLFPGFDIVDAYPFRVTRNTDMEIQEEEADDLLLTMEENLRKRHFGSVVRLQIDEKTPPHIREILQTNLQIHSNDIYVTSGNLGLSSLWQLHRLERPELKDVPHQPSMPPVLRTGENIFSILQRQEIMLHHPYDSFVPVVTFLEAAAQDPDVLTIKQTLYRIGSDSPMIDALIRARENGKQVAVLVELKARFDEESNIEGARALENAGVHVTYGVIGLKTHCKIALAVRRERDGIRRYVHLSTGNYNPSTARMYTDLGFFTSNEEMGADASELFNFLTGYSRQNEYRKFLVAPVTLRKKMLDMIERESKFGEKGRILIKANSLVDPEIIKELYRASQAGVKIDAIIRGLCCLRPGIKGVSENISVISIVGRFLEHSRIYYFENGGKSEIFIGSADIMSRNLDRRVEVLFPIESPKLREMLVEKILKMQLQDTEKAYRLQSNGTYVRISETLEDGEEPFNSQEWFMKNPLILTSSTE